MARHMDSHGETCIHWAARRGWGSLIVAILRAAEKYKKGSTRGLLNIRNNKGHSAIDIGANETVKELIRREMSRLGEKEAERGVTRARLKRGLMKAKMVGVGGGGEMAAMKRGMEGAGKGKVVVVVVAVVSEGRERASTRRSISTNTNIKTGTWTVWKSCRAEYSKSRRESSSRKRQMQSGCAESTRRRKEAPILLITILGTAGCLMSY